MIKDLEHKIINDLKTLSETSDPSDIKDIVCAFYKGGTNKHPNCFGCPQTPEYLNECKAAYESLITKRPQEFWSPDFEKIRVREKVSIDEVQEDLGLRCDSCYLHDKCPKYEAKSSCAIDFGIPDADITPKKLLDFVIKIQTERVNRAKTIEKLDGGVADQNVSSELDRLASLIEKKNNLENAWSFEIKGKGSGEQSQGILAKLFGKKDDEPKALEESKVINLPTEDAQIVEEKVQPKSKKKRVEK